MVRKLTISLGRVFSKSKDTDTDRPPTPPPKSPPKHASIGLPLAAGSKFKEESVSAVFSATATTTTESIIGSFRPPSTSRLLKKHHHKTISSPGPYPASIDLSSTYSPTVTSFEVVPPLMTNPVPHPHPPPHDVISFCPATHPAESFTEDHRLQIPLHQNPYLTVLEKTSPEQFKRCTYLLRTSLPTNLDEVRDIIPKPNGLVHTILEAYNNHRGLILRPDDIWTALLTQFSFFVNARAEQLRTQFISHEGKEDLIIISGGNRHTADFALMARQMTELMHTHIVDPALRAWIVPEFSTTTDVDRTVYAMAMMATMKGYFRYTFMLRCGIPRVTILGERRDWEAILERLERLKLYGIETIAWYHLLHPIISQFIAAFDLAPPGSNSENENENVNVDFWGKVAHYEGGGSGPTYLSGWITAFCVFNEEGVWQGPTLDAERRGMGEDGPNPKKLLRPADPQTLSAAQFAAVYIVRGVQGRGRGWGREKPFLVLGGMPYPTIEDESVPCGYAHLDVKLDDNGEMFDTVIVAGAVGAQICSNERSELFRNGMRDSVRPVVGYWYFIAGGTLDK